MYVDYR
jgi:alkaline phosphatase D